MHTMTVVLGFVHTEAFLVLHQWGQAGAAVGGASLAELSPLLGTHQMMASTFHWERWRERGEEELH